MGEVDGRSLLPPQCATGEESLSWAVLGARVTAAPLTASPGRQVYAALGVG